MKLKQHLFGLLLMLPALCASLLAQALVLQPGESKTVAFDQLRYLEKGATPVKLPSVAGQATFTFNQDGKTLTVKFQNLSQAQSGATLYAFELGISARQAVQTRAEAQFADFPANARWMGPTDNSELTAGKGVFTFASREAVLRDFEEFLQRGQALPASFLQSGQQGSVTMRLDMSASVGKQSLLRLNPMMFFLAPDPTVSPLAGRLRLAARASGGNGNSQP